MRLLPCNLDYDNIIDFPMFYLEAEGFETALNKEIYVSHIDNDLVLGFAHKNAYFDKNRSTYLYNKICRYKECVILMNFWHRKI